LSSKRTAALAYPSAVLLPLTEDTALPIPDLSVAIEPSPDR
jgi:hypothetical protein